MRWASVHLTPFSVTCAHPANQNAHATSALHTKVTKAAKNGATKSLVASHAASHAASQSHAAIGVMDATEDADAVNLASFGCANSI